MKKLSPLLILLFCGCSDPYIERLDRIEATQAEIMATQSIYYDGQSNLIFKIPVGLVRNQQTIIASQAIIASNQTEIIKLIQGMAGRESGQAAIQE